MANVVWVDEFMDKLYLQSGEFTTTIKTSQSIQAVDTYLNGISYDLTNTPWSGQEANKEYLQSGQFTSTLKTSQSAGANIRDISWDRTNTPWIGMAVATFKLYLTSGQFSSTLKASQSVHTIDTLPNGISYDGTNTPWAGDITDKGYLTSGQFTATIKTSQAFPNGPGAISYNGTDTLYARNSDPKKLYRYSGQFTSVIKSSYNNGKDNFGIDTVDLNSRVPVVEPPFGSTSKTIAYSYQAINTNAIIFLAPSLTADDLTDADGGRVKEPIQTIAISHNGFLFSVNIAGVQRKLVRKFFIVNNSNQNIVSGKVWIQAQDQSPQLKIAHERNSIQQLILDGSTVAPIITGLPQNIPSYGVFSLHADEASGIQFGGDGNLPIGKRAGIWVLQTLEAGELPNQNADFTIRCGINFE